MTPRLTAVISCPHCSWKAMHTADSEEEVTEFLRAMRKKHCVEVHDSKEEKP